MVVARSTHTFNPSTNGYLGTKNEWAAFPTRRFMHAFYDTPSAGAESTCAKFPAILDVSASADYHSSQEQQHWQARGSKLINEITPKYVQQLLSELEQERAARHCASRENEALREEVESLKEDNSRLENDLDQSQVERSVLEMDLELVREHEIPQMAEEIETLKKECILVTRRPEEGSANPPPCTLPHGMSERKREMIKRLEKDMARLETDLEQSQLERSVLEADLMLLRKQEMPELLEENEGLKDKCESLTCQLDNAYDEIRALAYPAPTPASSIDLESNNGMEDGDSQSIEIAELRFDCDDSRQRITVLERQVYMLAEKLEHTHGQLDRVNQDTLHSGVHEATVAPTMAESACDQIREQSNLDNERSGLATPSESGKSKDFFYPGLEHPESLQPETMVAPLTPPPTPQLVFPIYYTGDTLVYLEAETMTTKAPAKAVTVTKAAAKKAATATKTAAVKAANSIRKAASAMAHMRFHH
ncbi:hypothetical protein EV177_007566 [Coemansia sp. RSA 1804]|nr:hypothetical protein EV177_007566 [Coemansia sp. RSA 1804]